MSDQGAKIGVFNPSLLIPNPGIISSSFLDQSYYHLYLEKLLFIISYIYYHIYQCDFSVLNVLDADHQKFFENSSSGWAVKLKKIGLFPYALNFPHVLVVCKCLETTFPFRFMTAFSSVHRLGSGTMWTVIMGDEWCGCFLQHKSATVVTLAVIYLFQYIGLLGWTFPQRSG